MSHYVLDSTILQQINLVAAILCFVLNSSVCLQDGGTKEKKADNCHTLCCIGWQSGSIHSLWFSLPDCRIASLGLGKVQYYSTSDNSKDDPPKPASSGAPSTEKILSGAAKATPSSLGEKLMSLYIAEVVKMFTVCS